jgi:hypothetical protein
MLAWCYAGHKFLVLPEQWATAVVPAGQSLGWCKPRWPVNVDEWISTERLLKIFCHITRTHAETFQRLVVVGCSAVQTHGGLGSNEI